MCKFIQTHLKVFLIGERSEPTFNALSVLVRLFNPSSLGGERLRRSRDGLPLMLEFSIHILNMRKTRVCVCVWVSVGGVH